MGFRLVMNLFANLEYKSKFALKIFVNLLQIVVSHLVHHLF